MSMPAVQHAFSVFPDQNSEAQPSRRPLLTRSTSTAIEAREALYDALDGDARHCCSISCQGRGGGALLQRAAAGRADFTDVADAIEPSSTNCAHPFSFPSSVVLEHAFPQQPWRQKAALSAMVAEAASLSGALATRDGVATSLAASLFGQYAGHG